MFLYYLHLADGMATVFATKEQVEQEVARLKIDPRYLSLLLPTDGTNYRNYLLALALVFDMPSDHLLGDKLPELEHESKFIIDDIRNIDITPRLPTVKNNKWGFKSFWNTYEMLDADEVDYSVISVVWLYLFNPDGFDHYNHDVFPHACLDDEGNLEEPSMAKNRNDFLEYIKKHYASAEIYYHRILTFLCKEDKHWFEYTNMEDVNKQLWRA